MKKIFISLLILFSTNLLLIGQPANYGWIAEFDGNYGNTRVFSDSDVNSTIRSLTVLANSATDEYVIEWDSYNNKWQNGESPLNSEFTLFHGSGASPNGVISGGVQNAKYYTFQIDGLAYSNRQAVIMETDNTPQSFHATSPIEQAPVTVFPGQAVTVTVTLAGNKSSQEKVFVRYTSNAWSSSAVVEATGSGSTWSTATATIPASVNVPGASIEYYAYSTTVAATDVSNHDLITLRIANNGGINYSYSVQNGWSTTADGNWSTAATWTANAVPSTTQNLGALTISNDVTLDQNATVSSITIDNTKTLNAGSSTINVSSAGTFTNNGTFNAGSGKVVFAGSGSVAGTVIFNTVEIAGGVDFGSASTINGTLRINSGGYLSQTAGGAGIVDEADIPVYGADATLAFTGTFDINSLASGWGTIPTKFPNNLSIEGTAVTTLSIARGITGNVDIASGATFNSGGNLTLRSSSSKTASMKNMGVFNGNINSERYIAAANWASSQDGFHLLSSPVAAEAISGEWTPSGAGNDYDFYGWSELHQKWVNKKNVDPLDPPTWADFHPEANFNVGQGYLVAYETAETKIFSGALNNGNQSVTLKLSGTPAVNNSYGYNLIGNPFTSALDWTHASWGTENSNYGGVAKIWSGGAFIDVVTADPVDTDVTIIPAMNGFFVYTNVDENDFTIPAAAQVHSSDNWHKSVNNNTKVIKLKVKGINSNLTQVSSIRFNSETTTGFDLAFDSYFMPGYAPVFYSVSEGKNYSTNALPSYDSETVIPFVFVKNENSEFVLELTNGIEGEPIYLTDKKTGTIHKLSENPVYAFTSEAGDSPDRFLLHFGVVGLGEQDAASQLQAYVYGDQLYLMGAEGTTQVSVYDIQGRLVQQVQANISGLYSQSLKLPAGVYVVRLQNETASSATKIVIK